MGDPECNDEKYANVADATSNWRKLPYALLLASLFVFGCFPKLLTNQIEPDADKIVQMANGSTAVPAVVVGVAPMTLLAGVTPTNARETRALPEISNSKSEIRN